MQPTEANDGKTSKLASLFFAVELLYLCLSVVMPLIAGDKAGIKFTSHVVFGIYFGLRFIVAFLIKSEIQGILKAEDLPSL